MKKKKNTKTGKIFRYHSMLTSGVMLVYLGAGFIGGRQLLFSDIQHKGKIAGAMVSAVVRAFGPPKTPVVTASSGCSIQKNPFIHLQWPADEDATSFDLYRNDAELMLGLIENDYTDSNIASETSYTYYVIAKGPKGTATSESATVLADKCPVITNPAVIITTFEGKNNESSNGIPLTTEEKPIFSGTTNIPNAIIELEIHSDQVIYATTQANENGYWQWSPPVSLPEGTHTLYITAVDPLDPATVAVSSFTFKIKKDKESNDNDKKKKDSISSAAPSGTISDESQLTVSQNGENINNEEIQKTTERPLDFDIKLKNSGYIKGVNIGEEAYRGEDLDVKILFTDVVKDNQEINLKYVLSSLDQRILAEYNDNIKIDSGREITKKIPLPANSELGKYKIQVSATIENMTVSHESYFVLKDRPILQIGAGYVTYIDLVSNLGWLTFISLLMLIFIGSAVLWERHLAQKAIFRITGKFLRKKGFTN